MIKFLTKYFVLVALSLGLFNTAIAAESAKLSNKIERIDFSVLSGGRVSIRVKMTEPLSSPPTGFTLKSPARIALDFPNTANGLSKSHISNTKGVLKSITLAQAKDRTRMVLNLSKASGYNAEVQCNDVIITLQGNDALTANRPKKTRFAKPVARSQDYSITGVDFARGVNGEGRVIVDLSGTNAGINIKQKGKQIIVDFVNTGVPAAALKCD